MAKVVLSRIELEDKPLPKLCMRCGEPATLIKHKRFFWGAGWVLLLLFIGAVCVGPLFWVALILIPILLRQMKVPVPLCERHRNHWLPLQTILYGGVGIIAILVFSIVILSVIVFNRVKPGHADPLAGVILWLFGITVAFLVITAFPAAILQANVIRPTLINNEVIELSGVAREFADRLQEERRKRMRATPRG
jgi:hypothetical protein